MNPIEFNNKLGDPTEKIKWLCLIYGKKSFLENLFWKLKKKTLLSNILVYITQMYEILIEFNYRKGHILLFFSISKRNWIEKPTYG